MRTHARFRLVSADGITNDPNKSVHLANHQRNDVKNAIRKTTQIQLVPALGAQVLERDANTGLLQAVAGKSFPGSSASVPHDGTGERMHRREFFFFWCPASDPRSSDPGGKLEKASRVYHWPLAIGHDVDARVDGAGPAICLSNEFRCVHPQPLSGIPFFVLSNLENVDAVAPTNG